MKETWNTRCSHEVETMSMIQLQTKAELIEQHCYEISRSQILTHIFIIHMYICKIPLNFEVQKHAAPITTPQKATAGSERHIRHVKKCISPRKISDTHFCQRLSVPQSHSAAGRIGSIENSNNIRNRTHNLPACSIMPPPTTLPCAPDPFFTLVTIMSDHQIFIF